MLLARRLLTGARLVERDDSRVAPVIYREEGLHPGLSEWVTCAWTYERVYGDEDFETVMPDGTVELVVQLAAPYTDAGVELPTCVAIGTLDRPLVLTAEGAMQVWCVRFPWWGLAPFGDVSAFAGRQWAAAGEADTFARWIAAAIETYAARTPKQRATAQPRGRADERTGSTRSFAIPTDTVARMRAAINADQQAGRWPSDSAWCSEAIAAAVDAARTKNDGSLPTPPPRLPNRLVR